mmetsp:Transcript_891/g.2962  ORF Transcript_891/g.2962 Transcript_891/m.2962 type:complete len:205 (-) Transcript_891:174-788(-)
MAVKTALVATLPQSLYAVHVTDRFLGQYLCQFVFGSYVTRSDPVAAGYFSHRSAPDTFAPPRMASHAFIGGRYSFHVLATIVCGSAPVTSIGPSQSGVVSALHTTSPFNVPNPTILIEPNWSPITMRTEHDVCTFRSSAPLAPVKIMLVHASSFDPPADSRKVSPVLTDVVLRPPLDLRTSVTVDDPPVPVAAIVHPTLSPFQA